MPRRSNSFQRLVRFLESQLAGSGATVSESALVTPLVLGPVREVDVLVEHEVGGRTLRIGIECRAHARRQGLEWIEQVAAKYEHLPIDRVVVVSKSGFTKAALVLAEHHNIEALSLQAAMARDWPDAFTKWRLGLVTWHHPLRGFEVNYVDAPILDITEEDLASAEILGANGEVLGTMRDDIIALYNKFAADDVKKWAMEDWDTLRNQPEGTEWELRLTYNAHNRFLRTPAGEGRQLREVVLLVAASYRVERPALTYFRYATIAGATTSADSEGDKRRYTFTMVFGEDGRPRTLNIQADAQEQH